MAGHYTISETAGINSYYNIGSTSTKYDCTTKLQTTDNIEALTNKQITTNLEYVITLCGIGMGQHDNLQFRYDIK